MASGDYVVGRDIDFHISPGPPSRPASSAELTMNLPAAAKKKARKRAKKKKNGVDPNLDDVSTDGSTYSGSTHDFIGRDNTLPLWDFDPSIAKLTAVPAQIKRLKHNPFQSSTRKSATGNNSPFRVDDVIQYRTKLDAEHQEILKFWRSLGAKQREALVRVEKAEIFDVIHMERRECDCELCESKKDAIDAELDALYDVNYPTIERYMNRLLAGELTLSEELNRNHAPVTNKTGMSFHELKALNFKIPRAHNEYSDVHGTTVHNDASDTSQLASDVSESLEKSLDNSTPVEPASDGPFSCTCADTQCESDTNTLSNQLGEVSCKFTVDQDLASLCSDEYMHKVFKQTNSKLARAFTSSLLDVKFSGTNQGLEAIEHLAPETDIAKTSTSNNTNYNLLGSLIAINNSVSKLSSIEPTELAQIAGRVGAINPEPVNSLQMSLLKSSSDTPRDEDLDNLADDICGQLGIHQDSEKNLIQLITGILPLFTVKDLTEEDRYRIISRLMLSGKEHKDLFFDMIAQLANDLLGNNGSEIIELMESLQLTGMAKNPTSEEPKSIPDPLTVSEILTPSDNVNPQRDSEPNAHVCTAEHDVNQNSKHNSGGSDDLLMRSKTSVGADTQKPDSASNTDMSTTQSIPDVIKNCVEPQHCAKTPAEQEVHDYYNQLKSEMEEDVDCSDYSELDSSKMDKKHSGFDIEVEISELSEATDIPNALMYDPHVIPAAPARFDDNSMDVNHPLHEYFPDYAGSGIERTLPPDHASHTPSDDLGNIHNQEDIKSLNEDEILIDKEQRRLAKASWYLQNLYARIFEVRILTIYREHVAKMRQRLLLAELAAEEERANNEALRKAREKDKKKSKKLLAKQLRQEEERKKAMEEKKKQDALKAKEEARRMQQLEMDRAKQEAHRRKIEKRMAQLELNSRNATTSTNVSPLSSPKKDSITGGKELSNTPKKDDTIGNKSHENANHVINTKQLGLESNPLNKTQNSKSVGDKSKTETSKAPKTDVPRSESNSRSSEQSRLDKERVKLERQAAKKSEKVEKSRSEKYKLDRNKTDKLVEKTSAKTKSKVATSANPSSSQPGSQTNNTTSTSQPIAGTRQPTGPNASDPPIFSTPQQNLSSGTPDFSKISNVLMQPGISSQSGLVGMPNVKLQQQASIPISLEAGLSSNMDINATLKKNSQIPHGMVSQPFGFPPPGMGSVPHIPGMRIEPHSDMMMPPGMSPRGPVAHASSNNGAPIGPNVPANIPGSMAPNISTLNGVRGIGVNLGAKLSANIGTNITSSVGSAALGNGNISSGTLTSLHPTFSTLPSGQNVSITKNSPMNISVARPSVTLNRGISPPTQSTIPQFPGISNLWSPVSNTPSPKISNPTPTNVSWSRSPWSEPGNNEGKSSPKVSLGNSPWANSNRQSSESEIMDAARKGYNEVKNLGVDGLVPSQVLFHAVKSKLAMRITQQDLFRTLAGNKAVQLVRDDVGLVTHVKM